MPSVLFVCTGNLFRSPLAAALFSRELLIAKPPGEWRAESAGILAQNGKPVPSELVKAAAAVGIDIQNHRSRRVSESLLARFDLILVMERGHQEALQAQYPFLEEKIQLLTEVANKGHAGVLDPVRHSMRIEWMVETMSKMILAAFPTICTLALLNEPILFSDRSDVNYTL